MNDGWCWHANCAPCCANWCPSTFETPASKQAIRVVEKIARIKKLLLENKYFFFISVMFVLLGKEKNIKKNCAQCTDLIKKRNNSIVLNIVYTYIRGA